MHGIVDLSAVKLPAVVGDRVKLMVVAGLHQSVANRPFGGISLDRVGLVFVRLGEDRSSCQASLQFFESKLTLRRPGDRTKSLLSEFGIAFDEKVVKRAGDVGESLDVATVI